jgi:hypothetical protein
MVYKAERQEDHIRDAAPDLLRALENLLNHYCELKYSGPLWQAAEEAVRKAKRED